MRIKGLKHFRGDAKFSTWLMAITLNEARSHYRQTKGDQFNSLDYRGGAQGDYTPLISLVLYELLDFIKEFLSLCRWAAGGDRLP
jgi:DNA-directed RNA polymerase specialized sigma24 family protein